MRGADPPLNYIIKLIISFNLIEVFLLDIVIVDSPFQLSDVERGATCPPTSVVCVLFYI